MKALAVAVLTTAVMTVAACSGGGATVGDPNTTSGGPGGTDGGTSTDASCTTRKTKATRACVPKVARANEATTLEIEGEGCVGCGTTLAPCKVTIEPAQKIVLELSVNQCPLPSNVSCAAACGIPKTTCTVPPLAAGEYRIELGTDVRLSSDESRTLIVAAEGETSCALPLGPPPPLVGDDFPRTCTTGNDAECTLVIEGDACAVCACPGVAIATSALPSYEAARRSLRSACTNLDDSPACAACPQTKAAKCVAGTCQAVAK